MAKAQPPESGGMDDELEERIRQVYGQAAQELNAKFEKYMADFARKDEQKRKLVETGKMTKEDYAQWRKGQVLIGERWREMRDSLATDLTNADRIAVSMINGYIPDAYALGHNYGTFLVENGSLIDTSYTLYSRETVERLIRDQPRLLNVTQWELNHPRDQHWNQVHITQQITQGILQGEDIRQVAGRLQNVTSMDQRAAIRNARTALTGAQNGGRIDAYQRAVDMGIRTEKEWLATMDSHTRDSHVDMDGEHVPVDGAFSNGLSYPGEMGGPPAEVYNCRCTLIPRLERFDYSKDNDLRWRREETLGNMSWEEWKYSHSGRIRYQYSGGTTQGYTMRGRMQIEQMLRNDGDSGRLYQQLSGEMREPIGHDDRDRAYFSPSGGRVHLNLAASEQGSNYNSPHAVHFHEYGHNMDYLLGRPSRDWRNADGKSFGDLIWEDWNNSIRNFLMSNDGAPIYEKELLSQFESGGMGGQSFLRYMARHYRLENGIARDSDEFQKLWGEILAINPENERAESLEFWNRHRDIFEPFLLREEPTSTQINAFIDFINSNHSLMARSDISDMFENYSVVHGGPDYPFGIGHGSGYWGRGDITEATEAFAEMTSATICQNESLGLIQQYLPNAYNAYLEMVGGVLKK